MKENLKLIPDKSGQNSKLRIFLALNVIFCILFFIPIISDAAYKIHLKNGRTISGIEEIKHGNGNVKIFKEGILLDMPKTNILKIEEYKPAFVEKEPQEEGAAESGETPVESQSPDYTDYRKSYKTAHVEEPAEETVGEEATEETPMEEKSGETDAEIKHKTKTTGAGEFKDGVLEPDSQLKELRKREEDKTLPKQFKPYKDFLEKQYQQYQPQKKHVEEKK
ncbi:MAG: hypothetical protein AABZ36_02175 [Nitrospirota bacterium]